MHALEEIASAYPEHSRLRAHVGRSAGRRCGNAVQTHAPEQERESGERGMSHFGGQAPAKLAQNRPAGWEVDRAPPIRQFAVRLEDDRTASHAPERGPCHRTTSGTRLWVDAEGNAPATGTFGRLRGMTCGHGRNPYRDSVREAPLPWCFAPTVCKPQAERGDVPDREQPVRHIRIQTRERHSDPGRSGADSILRDGARVRCCFACFRAATERFMWCALNRAAAKGFQTHASSVLYHCRR